MLISGEFQGPPAKCGQCGSSFGQQANTILICPHCNKSGKAMEVGKALGRLCPSCVNSLSGKFPCPGCGRRMQKTVIFH
ncbi:MAG: hypothetical protein ACI96M_000415 [Candidatus Azotimanducaceae bacterium]|jgi:hypothetical protein